MHVRCAFISDSYCIVWIYVLLSSMYVISPPLLQDNLTRGDNKDTVCIEMDLQYFILLYFHCWLHTATQYETLLSGPGTDQHCYFLQPKTAEAMILSLFSYITNKLSWNKTFLSVISPFLHRFEKQEKLWRVAGLSAEIWFAMSFTIKEYLNKIFLHFNLVDCTITTEPTETCWQLHWMENTSDSMRNSVCISAVIFCHYELRFHKTVTSSSSFIVL